MINDWGLTYNIIYAVSESKKRINERESFSVKVCPQCDIVFEMVHNQYKQVSTTHYYKNFPRRGLYNQVCFACK